MRLREIRVSKQTKTATLQELNSLIDVATVYNESEDKWFKAQRRKRGILELLIASIPLFVFVGFISWYLIGAPHTVSVIGMITTPTNFFGYIINWAVVAPIGLELGILLVAIMKSAGWKSSTNSRIEFGLVLMSIVINLFGSLIEVQNHLDLSNLQWIAGIIIATLMGFCIPIMTAWTGSALVKLATGQVKFDIVDLSSKWVIEGRDFFRRELYRMALSKGASTANSSKFSDRVSRQYFQNIDVSQMLDKVGQSQVPKLSHPVQNGATMGFSQMAETRAGIDVHEMSDNRDKSEQTGQVPNRGQMTQQIVKEWIIDNSDELQQILDENKTSGKRQTASLIAIRMGYMPSQYKTIERVLGDRLK